MENVAQDRFTYVDRDVSDGTYRYMIGVIEEGSEFLSPTLNVHIRKTVASLEQNTPNPFNPATTIRFTLPSSEHVRLDVYDAAGRRVRTLVDEVRARGPHQVEWDGRDEHAVALASGIYFYRLTARGFAESKKMALLK